MPNTDRNGLAISVIEVPGQDESCSGPARTGGDLLHQPGVAADPREPGDGHRDEQRQDHEELQHLVVDRRRQAAEEGVAENHQRGHRDRDRLRPAEQRLEHQAERVQVDPRDQQRGQREDHAPAPAGWSG